jgi:hypothetical protein
MPHFAQALVLILHLTVYAHGLSLGAAPLDFTAMPLDFTASNAAPLIHVNFDLAQARRLQSMNGAAHAVISAATEDARQLSMSFTDTNEERSANAIAWASYNNTVSQNGWTYLSVATSSDQRFSADLKMYAAGFLEGLLSAQQIRDFQHNTEVANEASEDNHHARGNILDMFEKDLQEISRRSGLQKGRPIAVAAANASRDMSDAWWRHARYTLIQAWGIKDAYNSQVNYVNGHPMSIVDLFFLNSDGETPELEMAYDSEETLLREQSDDGSNVETAGQSFLQRTHTHHQRAAANSKSEASAMTPSSANLRASSAKRRRAESMRKLDERVWRKIMASSGRCSALVRLTADDIMVGHTTFSDYSEMTRIFKYYDFPLEEDSVRRMGFSSYPGVAGSTDDYYLLDSGIVITETTISMLTDEPYDKIDTRPSVPDFMRIMISNRLAKTAVDWAELMKQSSTGTYSSQWMIVDYNKFTPGQPLQDGTLVVVEQVPGLSHVEDVTKTLQERGFWSSQNRAAFKDIRDSMGATDAEQLHGDVFSADKNPRAHIFAATATHVESIADMRDEMRRNKWPNEIDGGSGNTPDHAIAARGDLDRESPSPNGGVDSKVTNRCLARLLQCDAISGPSAATQKPFRWLSDSGRELYPGTPHDGMPDVWNFDWVRMTPQGEASLTSENECH